LGGAFLLAISCYLLKLTLFDTLREAETHEPRLQISAILIASPAFFALGFSLLVFGDGATQWMKRHEKLPDGRPSPVRRIVIGAAFGVGLLLYAWQQHRLSQLGYR
jgi:hypothetical protein